MKVLLLGGAVTDPNQAQATLSLATPALAKMETEAALMASLRHPNVASWGRAGEGALLAAGIPCSAVQLGWAAGVDGSSPHSICRLTFWG